ncbi:MAG: DUF4339 domain-containing protein [Verrucomicrobiota bacterium]
MTNSQEVFYLHLQGEQRGPYTIKHIDHLLNSGLISEDSLFWREGLDQWLPVTQLVTLRRRRKPWELPAVTLAVLLLFGLLTYIFGPITLDGWREIYQHDFTAEAAYWRARDVVRTQCVPKGGLVIFQAFSSAEVQLNNSNGGQVVVHGTLTEAGGASRSTAWKVILKYDPPKREWSGLQVNELPPPQK